MSSRFLDGAFVPEMVAEARDNPVLLAALGNAVFEADLKSLEAELRQQLGDSWLDRYLELNESPGLTPNRFPSTELVNDANLRPGVLPSEATGNDEIAVLRCILFRKTQPLVFRPTTTMPAGWHTEAELAEIGSYLLKMTASGLETETIADFLEANRKPWPVAPDLIFDQRMICLGAEEMAEMSSSPDNWWERYRERHPGAIELIEFSRVGFNWNRTQALVYIGSRMNWNAGDGGYHLLSKSANGWSCVASEMAWVT